MGTEEGEHGVEKERHSLSVGDAVEEAAGFPEVHEVLGSFLDFSRGLQPVVNEFPGLKQEKQSKVLL